MSDDLALWGRRGMAESYPNIVLIKFKKKIDWAGGGIEYSIWLSASIKYFDLDHQRQLF